MAKEQAAKKGKLLAGGITEQQLNEWKAKHGTDKIRVIEVDKDAKTTLTCYGRFPTLDEIAAAELVPTMIQKGELLYNSCYLDGDPETKADEQVKLAVYHQFNQMFRLYAGRTKNA